MTTSQQPIDEIQAAIVEEFRAQGDALDQYELLLRYAADLPSLDDSFKTGQNLVEGCQSTAWLVLDEHDGNVRIAGDSDTLIIRGVINLLIRVLDDRPARDIAYAQLYFLEESDAMATFTTSRRAGVGKMVETILEFARAKAEPRRATRPPSP